MRLIFFLLALQALAGCGQPSTPLPVAPIATPAPAIAPGLSTIDHGWTWHRQGAPSQALASVLEQAKTPEAIGAYLLKNVEWRDDYDTHEFLNPEQLVERKAGVCTAFARLWVYALAKQGIKADFVAFWSKASAHAVAVFRAPDGRYRMGSNQNYYSSLDLDPGNDGREAALIAAAREFYGDGWVNIQVFSEHGVILQEFKNTKTANVPLDAPPGVNLFRITR